MKLSGRIIQFNLCHVKNQIIQFFLKLKLFNCLDKFGKPASILFSVIDFGEEKTEVVKRLLENYPKKFDFNLMNITLTKTVKNLTSEMITQKEEYSIMLKKMQET